MPDTGMDRARLRTRWWRPALVTAGVAVAAFSWRDPFLAVFALIPILVWSGGMARTDRIGIRAGIVLLVLLAWFVVPRELWLAGAWVPSWIEVYWLHTTLAAVVCAVGARLERRRPRGTGRLVTMVVAGFVVTGGVLFWSMEDPPGDEHVLPGPEQLQVVEDRDGGSGGMFGVLEATGDRAPEVMRAYLEAHNFTPRPSELAQLFCRRTGIVVEYRECASMRTISATDVRVDWSAG